MRPTDRRPPAALELLLPLLLLLAPLLLAAAGCATALAAPGDEDGARASGAAAASPAPGGGEWLPGDCHVHARPGDDDGHVWASLDGTLRAARRQGVRWMILTPHFWRGKAKEEARVDALAAFHDQLGARNRWAANAMDRDAPLLIPGIEETRRDPGHLGLSFVDLRDAWAARARHEGSLALAGRARGGFLVLNHPFGDFAADMSWKPWTAGSGGTAEGRAITERADAIEAWNGMMGLGERILGRARPRHQSEQAFAAIDRAGLAGRRIVGVGGSDDHNTLFFKATTWALVRGPLTERSLLEALRAGRVVCGVSPAAGSFSGASDLDPEPAPPGSAIAADREVRLAWRGKAEVWRDGACLGERDGGLVDAIDAGTRHVYRIVVREKAGPSYANPIYVNLEEAGTARIQAF